MSMSSAVSHASWWRKYASVLSIGVQDTFVYRWNFALRAIFSIVPLLGTIYIWRAVFQARGGNIGRYDQSEMVFYFLLALLVENLVTPTEDEWRIAAEIRDGQISALILKPLHHLTYRLSLFASYRGLYTVVTTPIVAVVFLFFREYLRLPAYGSTWPLFALSATMAALIQFFIAYALAMLAFWILEISTVVFIFYSFEYFLNGQIVPLDIMPAWLQVFLKYSPFTYELFFPVQVYLEHLPPAQLYQGLAIQLTWVLITYTAARLMWRLGVRRYQAVGG